MTTPETQELPEPSDIGTRIFALPKEDRWDAVVEEALRVWTDAERKHLKALKALGMALLTNDSAKTDEFRFDVEASTAYRDSAIQAVHAAQAQRDAHLSREIAKAATAHSRNLMIATWVLAFATVGLIIATLAA